MLFRSRPSLFASKNHQALEAVLPRLNDGSSGRDLIIQTASRDLAQRQSYLAKLQSLLIRPTRRDAEEGDGCLSKLREAFARQAEALEGIRLLQNMRAEYAQLNQTLAAVKGQLGGDTRVEAAIAEWPAAITQQQLEQFESELREIGRAHV